jgi:hypothetical protein
MMYQSASAPTQNPNTVMTATAQTATERAFSIDLTPIRDCPDNLQRIKSVPKMRIRRCRTVAPVDGARCVMPMCPRQRCTRLGAWQCGLASKAVLRCSPARHTTGWDEGKDYGEPRTHRRLPLIPVSGPAPRAMRDRRVSSRSAATRGSKKDRLNLRAVTASLHSSLPHGGEPMVQAASWRRASRRGQPEIAITWHRAPALRTSLPTPHRSASARPKSRSTLLRPPKRARATARARYRSERLENASAGAERLSCSQS